ncbi:DNA repair protein RecN [Mesobaculum littorinae]|uniref:DNA repair protein RecN n=1 Tax=Mesobaculum littorinae TaxID=2486419 RepID=A0A438AIZ6_9RHOB|nr:DNA repair protein RecN [Mesobaculum littorinae]RVV98626.1 DNA repair protein RecN [Mesobaculum littorinae]
MLRGLEIRDMLLIDRLDLDFQSGLNVLTGETGAGKSILLDALGFVLGWRGRAELVRQGAETGEVTAEFDLPEGHAARAVLEEAGIDAEDGLLLRRVNTREGRKTAWVNDRRASGEVLRRLSETLVELHGQHDDRGLLNPRGHRRLLDSFAGADAALDAARRAWRARSDARRAAEAARARLAEVQAEEEFLRHAAGELDALAPEAGEEAALDVRRRQMQAAERVREDVARALQALGGEGAEGLAADAARWLDGAAAGLEGALDTAMETLERARNELALAEQEVAGALDALDIDPGELERTEERLFAIRGLARKHGVLADDLAGFAEDLRTKLAQLDAGAADIEALDAQVSQADAAYDRAAGALSDLRREAAGRLDAAMAAELAPLKMERAVFATTIEQGEPGPEGRDLVAFTVATNPGAPPGPLDRIASGGELSRFLLALKVCLTRDASGMTLIFDEIDRGVGGATADAVGRRLAQLSGEAQVLVVTHSPQVAALGAHHWRVEKSVADGMTTSRVVPLDHDERVDEIARMLAGDIVTEEARGAARALLGSAAAA